MPHNFSDDDIVITGISGKFPLANNLQEFKDNLFNKTNCIGHADERWPSELPGFSGNYVGRVQHLDKFDNEFFGITFHAAQMDGPPARLLAEICHEAIVDSGYDFKDLSGKDIGVFVGASDRDTFLLERGFSNRYHSEDFPLRYVGFMLSNRINFRCNLRGPSFTMYAACSSSACALEDAFLRIQEGSIEGALVGASSICLEPEANEIYSKLGMLSPTGETFAYSDNANGFAVGDALAMIFVQKKKDARRIYAKIHNIECTSVINRPYDNMRLNECEAAGGVLSVTSKRNRSRRLRPVPFEIPQSLRSPGTKCMMDLPCPRFNSITLFTVRRVFQSLSSSSEEDSNMRLPKGLETHLAVTNHSDTVIKYFKSIFPPSMEDQMNLFKRTYGDIGMDPSLVDYIEGNGVATQEGDATEVNSIDEFFCKNRKTPLLLGTVKSNIGHTESACALSSIAKVILSFEAGAIAPNIHHTAPNSKCPSLTDGKIKVVTETTPYETPLAAINNYGYGGTISHMVLERNNIERSQNQERSTLTIPKLVVYARTTHEALTKMFNYFQENSMPEEFFGLLNNSAYTSPLLAPYRGFTILEKDALSKMCVERILPVKRPLWYVLTGIVCSQWLGMYLELMEVKAFAESLKRSAELLEPFGIDLLYLLNPESARNKENLTQTFVSFISMQVALIDLLNALRLDPDGIVGHGTGELVCSYADGCCTAEQAVLSAYHIGVSVEKANIPPGAMAAVGLTWEEAKRRCPEGVYLACHEAEDGVTVSGPEKEVKRFVEELSKENISANVINTNWFAFHCKHVTKVTDKLRSTLKKMYTSVEPRKKRWVSTSYSERECNEPQIADSDYYCHNLESEAHFREVLSHIPTDAIIIEVGPHFLLPSVVSKVVGSTASYIDIPKRSENNIVGLLSSIGKLYNLGLDPQVANLYEPVSYPVPRGTPMIAPFIEWNHCKSFHVPKYVEECMSQTTFFTRTDSRDKFLLDHCIDGRSIYPAAGYLYLAWMGFGVMLRKPMDSLPVCIENLKIFRATILSSGGLLNKKSFLVKILNKSGNFEITEGDSVVASGRIYVSTTTMFDDSSYHYKPNECSITVSGPDFYNELNIQGYEYGPAFQGLLEVNMEGTQGLVKWNDQWIPFLDSLFLFFGFGSSDFKLPVGVLSFKIDPTIHKDFVTKMKESKMKGVPVNYDKHIRKCTAPGVEIKDLKLQAVSRQTGYRGTPVMEEYSFVPHYETHAIFGTEKTAKCDSYIEVCNHLEKQIVCNMNGNDKFKKQIQDLQFNENLSDQEYLFNEEEDSKLMRSLRNVLQMLKFPNAAVHVEEQCENISDVLLEDMLFKNMISEKPLRSVLDVAAENCSGKMSIAEWCHNKPLVLKAIQQLMNTSITTKASYILIHSHTDALDPESLMEKDIQVEHVEGSDGVPSNLNNSCHLGVTCCITESTDTLKSCIRNLASLTKKQGFILVIHKHELTAAEQLMYTLSKLQFTITSEAEIEKLFQEEKLAVVSKKSSSFGMNTYLLRKLEEKAHLQEVCVVKVLDAEYDKWVEDLKKALSTEQEKGNSGTVLLVAQDTIINGIIGMVNCLRQEPGGDSIRCIFTDTSAPPFDLRNSFYSNVLENDLFMNVYINGTWGSFRHTTLPSDNPRILSDCAVIECPKPGDLSSLQWYESPSKNIKENDDVELYYVYYSALNFKDVMLATGKIAEYKFEGDERKNTSYISLGLEFSGRDKRGRRIMAMSSGCSLSNTVMGDLPISMEIPDQLTMKEAATIPVVYCTCYFALIIRGDLQHGESILIHSGTGGIGQAAIRIALSMDCEIFVTVGTPGKKVFLMKTFPRIKPENIGCSRNTTFEEMIMKQTKGKGVDVVLNSLADDKFQASVRCLGEHGRFLEIGQYDLQMNNDLGLEVFQKGISFYGCELDAFCCRNKHSMGLLSTVKALMDDGLKKGVVQPINSTVFSKDEVEKAFRYMATGKHIGKVLITMREEETTKQSLPSPLMVNAYSRVILYGNKSYIIIGGLGGFGIELAKWLVEKGAGTVILTSRYGARTQYHHLCLKRWQASGARVFVSTLDVSKRDEAQKLLKETSAMHGPIGGIFNSAVVLKDAFIENQTAKSFEEVCAPKADATKHLDELTRSMFPELDMFVCFSSVSCGRGNAGQTNYGYANSAMERICENRKKDGLHGLAIQWGIIGDVGVVHRHMGDDAMIGGVVAQKIKSCLDSLEQFLLQDKPVVSSFVSSDKSGLKTDSERIFVHMTKMFGVKSIEEINPYRTFGEMGVDSFFGLELRHTLQTTYDISLNLQQIQDLKITDLKKIVEDHGNKKNKSALQSSGQVFQSISFTGLQPTLATAAVVSMNRNTHGVPVLVIHGKDFFHEKHKYIYEGISHPAYVLQCTQETPMTSLKDMALWFLGEIGKVCPRTPVHLLSISSSGNLSLEMALQSEKLKGLQPDIKSLTILDGSLQLMEAHSTTELEKNKNAAMYESSDLCEFLSAFSDSDLTQLKKRLHDQRSLEDRMNTINSLGAPSDKATFMAAAEFHVRKQKLMRFDIPVGKMQKDITVIEAAEKVLPNDVSAVKSLLRQVCDGHITIHRIVGNGELLVGKSSADEVVTILNKFFESEKEI